MSNIAHQFLDVPERTNLLPIVRATWIFLRLGMLPSELDFLFDCSMFLTTKQIKTCAATVIGGPLVVFGYMLVRARCLVLLRGPSVELFLHVLLDACGASLAIEVDNFEGT